MMDNSNYNKLKSQPAYVKQTGGCQWVKDQLKITPNSLAVC